MSTTDRVLYYLFRFGSDGCSNIGTVINNRKGRVAASTGGGDYAAQMLLGRLRKAGLVEHAPSEGSTLWRLTRKGEKHVQELLPAMERSNSQLQETLAKAVNAALDSSTRTPMDAAEWFKRLPDEG